MVINPFKTLTQKWGNDMFGQDIGKLSLFIVLIFAWFVFASEAIGETSNYKHKALIESVQDISKPLIELEKNQ